MQEFEELSAPPTFDLRQRCLPTYIVIDVSYSMTPHRDLLNRTLQRLRVGLARRVTEFAQMSIIAFSSKAWLVIEMTDLGQVSVMPQVECGGNTNYGAAFDLVRQRIQVDVPMLSAQNKGVFRPAVFFLTDGVPNVSDWREPFQRLTDRSWRWRPQVIPY